ncbi:hypothetical protein SLUN_27945 [Streptomyces lunaelactis]|uniref:Uncharacterized protein n=1 Tax=Streptomyces lunaelactis TaxID=1535768 RepID=A0A2R4T8K8_9ACTN|nr:hypothetical protein [Streptomyces lunaelactis]AVZ75469.1 hypothetical protein SLUN_27945 [Streptomyces lunaelactis]NUK82903.1 hypothetical protein [Streptomyces lunaelactis]NUL03748.1 hypothetical protein [Streptomyces lunaelactis]
MPGSTTLGGGHGADSIEHTDAVRLASVLGELSGLLAVDGPNRLTDAQVSALCGGEVHHRQEFAGWIERVARELSRRVSA